MKRNLEVIWYVLAGLATWRVTSILHREEIAAPLRRKLGIVENGDDPDYWIYPLSFFSRAFQCFWCLSVWAGLGVTLLLFIFPPLILPFALSAIAILVRDWLNGEHGPFIEITETEEGESDEH